MAYSATSPFFSSRPPQPTGRTRMCDTEPGNSLQLKDIAKLNTYSVDRTTDGFETKKKSGSFQENDSGIHSTECESDCGHDVLLAGSEDNKPKIETEPLQNYVVQKSASARATLKRENGHQRKSVKKERKQDAGPEVESNGYQMTGHHMNHFTEKLANSKEEDSDNEESLSLSFNINENTEKEEIQPKDIPALSLAVPNSLRYTHEREGPNYGSFEIEGEIFKFRASGLNNSHDEYEPIPDGLVTEIIRACEEHNVEMLDMNQSPENWKEVHVYAKNASAIQSSIDMFMKNSFRSHIVQTHDCNDYLWFHEFCDSNNNSHLTGISLQVYKLQTGADRLTEIGRVKCELIMYGQYNENRANAIFVGFPAHLLFNDGECERLVTNHTETVEQIKNELQMDNARYELRFHNQTISLCLLETPKFAYAHYVSLQHRASSNNHNTCMKDMAIARLDETLLTTQLMRSIISAMNSKMMYDKGIQKAYQIQQPLQVKELAMLYAMSRRGLEICIGPHMRGNLHFVGDRSWWKKMDKIQQGIVRAHRVEFITEFPLVAGDCGSIVYLIRKVEGEDVLAPLGMFVGEAKIKPPSGKNIYQAVLLAQCIQHIQESYPEVSNMRQPMEADCEYMEEKIGSMQQTGDSGFETNHSQKRGPQPPKYDC